MKVLKVVATSLLVLVVTVAMLSVAAPRAKAQGEITINIKGSTLTDHGCDPTVWGIIINQIADEGLAPPSVHVIWENGSEEDVSLEKVTPGGVAHYNTTSNLDSRIIDAYTRIYAEWGGEFNLSHGPCGTPTATNTSTPNKINTPTKTNTPTATNTATRTATDPNPPTATSTGTITLTNTPTATNTGIPGATVTSGPSSTPTPTEPKLGGGRPTDSAAIPSLILVALTVLIYFTSRFERPGKI